MKASYKPTTIVSIALYLAIVAVCLSLLSQSSSAQTSISYPIVDTGQARCYDASGLIDCPAESEAFYGQDAQITGNTPSYTDNDDSTITDNVTGLIWQQSADTDGDGDIDAADKLTYDEAVAGAEALTLAGQSDWRLPTIKELYSLIDFSGIDPSGYNGSDTSGLIPFIDTDYFDFAYGDTDAGERIIDAQYASSTTYVSTTGNGSETLFGVNFADGRIKGYGLSLHGQDKTFYAIYVRDNTGYGVNDFVDNGDATITDNATGLMWAQNDSGNDVSDGLVWEEALAWVQEKNAENYLGYSDWRLPNVKELQGIVDYSRSPDTSASAAIDTLFNATAITNEAGEADYAAYWSSTTHANWSDAAGRFGAYVNFGRAMGYINDTWLDVHGAGAQRSDPKTGAPDDYPTGHGPQGDAIRIYNYVRLVRDVETSEDNAQAPGLARFNFLPLIRMGDADAGTVPEAAVAPRSGAERPSVPDAGQPMPGGQRPDLAAAASQLGVTEETVQAALGEPGQGPPDLVATAEELGVTEEKLRAALGLATDAPPADGQPNGQPPVDSN